MFPLLLAIPPKIYISISFNIITPTNMKNNK